MTTISLAVQVRDCGQHAARKRDQPEQHDEPARQPHALQPDAQRVPGLPRTKP